MQLNSNFLKRATISALALTAPAAASAEAPNTNFGEQQIDHLFPSIDLGVDAAGMRAMFGTTLGSVVPIGEHFFMHSHGTAKSSRIDIGVKTNNGFAASVGVSGYIGSGEPFDYGLGVLPTTDLKSAATISASKAFPFGEDMRIAGKQVRSGQIAFGVSTDIYSLYAQTTRVGNETYLTRMPEERGFGSDVKIHLGGELRF